MAFQNRRPGLRQTDRLSPNHKLLYQYIRTQGPLARADLVRISDLTFPSISRMVAELLELGLVQETTQRRGGMGKPPTELVLVPETACSLGLAVGLTRTEAVVIDAVGTVVEKTEVEAEENLGSSFRHALSALKTPATKLVGVGVTRAGNALDAQELEALEEEIGLTVASASRAGAGALRERYFGAAQTLDTFFYLGVGDDLMSAALLGRRLLAPADQLSGLTNVLGEHLAAGSASWSENLATLSKALRVNEQLLAPEAFIVGGDVSDAQIEELTRALQEQRPADAPATPLVKGFSGPEEGSLAAATLPLYSTFSVAAPIGTPSSRGTVSN